MDKITWFSLVLISIPLPLLLLLELYVKLYCFFGRFKKTEDMSCTLSLLFNLRSHRKIMSLPISAIAYNFLDCLGQLVDTFRELQF